MNIQQINLGLYPNDGTGDDLRTAFEKTINNFSEIDSNVVLSAENLGTGLPIVLENPVNNKLQFRTLKSGSNKLDISFDSNELTLTVRDLALEELSDVSSTAATDKQVLSWMTDQWMPVSLDLSYLSDVAASNPSVGDSLVWNGTRWVPRGLQTGVSRIIAGSNISIDPLNGIGEVTISSTSSGSGIGAGFDFGGITNPTNAIELLLQATPIDFGTIAFPSSLYLDLGYIGSAPAPVYGLSSSTAQVLESGSFTITLTTSNVSNGTLVPYTITGVSSSDINNASLTGNFTVVNNVATLTVQTSVDGIAEGPEFFTLTLNNVTPAVSVTVNIVENAVPVVNGGVPGTVTFSSIVDGSTPTETSFVDILDGGPVVYVAFSDALVNGGSPTDTDFSTIVDGESPSTPVTVILDGGIVT